MRTIELSNHPADALRLARQRRADAGRPGRAGRASRASQAGHAGMQDFDEALARHKLLVKRACNARDRARAQRHWLTWLRGVLAVSRLRRLAPVPPAAVGGAAGTAAGGAPVAASDAEEILRAGITGEQQVVADLGQVLGDDWVMVRGYCNRRGEIDHLLLGPPGLIAIESKHLNATVTCDGDVWRFEKFDRYGNLVERGSLGDKRGRSPSVQLNEPADMLAEFLSTRGSKVSILRVVLLTHPNSKLGKCRNATVHIGTSSRTLARQLAGLPPVVGAAQRARLEELIARDHRYHEERRQRPPAARPPAARPPATPGAQPPAGRRATSRRAATARPPGRERA